MNRADHSPKIDIAPGCRFYPDYLGSGEQQELLAQIRAVLVQAPLFQPLMPRTGKPFSVKMSNMGELGWVSDKEQGYRYQATHPATGKPWPKIPPSLLQLWQDLIDYPLSPEVCLINYYDHKARMGLHRDLDEEDMQAPIVSISLGDKARFRLGGCARRDPSRTFSLASGDILVLETPLRLAYHGIDRLLAGSSKLLVEGGRFNLTMRRVTAGGVS